MFLNKVYHSMAEMDSAAVVNKRPRPFAFDYFNVKCYMANPLSQLMEIPARITNCIVKAMNERVKLPAIIVIVPDWDIIHFIDFFSYGFKKIAEKIVKWMAKTISRAIDERKQELFAARRGAITPGEPKIVWLEMINRIHIFHKVLSMRHKFNSALHSILADYKHNYIMSVNRAMFDASLFDSSGKLNKPWENQILVRSQRSASSIRMWQNQFAPNYREERQWQQQWRQAQTSITTKRQKLFRHKSIPPVSRQKKQALLK